MADVLAPHFASIYLRAAKPFLSLAHRGAEMKPPAAAIILVAGLSTMAQAAETGTLTLACKGMTALGDANPDPVSMGLIVNFTTGTVQGFGNPGLLDYPVKITGINDVTVAFGGGSERQLTSDHVSITGSIDRVTGDVEATKIMANAKTGNVYASLTYSLKCRPTQRMF
jgi:hypothetical protein